MESKNKENVMQEELVEMNETNEDLVGSITLHSNTGAKMVVQPLGMTMGNWNSVMQEVTNRNEVYLNFTTVDGIVSAVNLSSYDGFEATPRKVLNKKNFELELTDLPTAGRLNKYVEAFYDMMGDRWISEKELKSWQLVWELVKKEKENE